MSTQPAQPRHALFAATLVLLAGSAGAQAQVPDPGEAVQALLQVAEAEVAAAQALLAGLPQEAQEALAEHLAAAQAALQDAQGTVGDVAQQAMQRAEAELAAAQALLEGLPGAAQQALQEHLAAAQAALAEAQAAALAAYRDARDQARGAACPASRDALLVGPVVVWTNCNMGPGSGLDADTLDGFQARGFLDRIAAEAATRAAEDAALHQRIDTIKLDLEEAIAAEARLREAGDSRLADALASEVADRKAEVARLDGLLAQETAAREAADGALRAGLDREIADRQAALAAEGSARAAADDALAGRARSLEAFVNGGNYLGTSATLSGGATFGGKVGIGAVSQAGSLVVGQSTPGNQADYPVALLRHGTIYAPGAYSATAALRVMDFAADGPATLDFGGLVRVSYPRIADNEPNAAKATLLSVDNDSGHALRVDGNRNVWVGWYPATTSSQTQSLLVGGNVGIGTESPTARLHVTGDIRADGHIFAHTGSHVGDVAEPVVGIGLEPGEVVVSDGFTLEGKLRVKKADEAYAKRVVGVVSTNPSLRLAGLSTDTPLAVTGIVPIKIVGPVDEGDLLTTSGTPGHAMACKDPAACFGAVLGKALEGHSDGAGVVRAMIGLG